MGKCQYNARMKTMTATKARQSLGTLLSRVLEGEDIGIIHSGTGKIIALRPVEVYSDDYALMEYGVSDQEMKRAVRNITRKAKSERTRRWDGRVESLRG